MRPSYIKRIAKTLAEKFPNVFTSNFDDDKKLVSKYTNVESKKVRNRIAGYVASIVKFSQYEYVAPEEEELPEDYTEYDFTRRKEAKEEAEEEAEEEVLEEAEEEEIIEEVAEEETGKKKKEKTKKEKPEKKEKTKKEKPEKKEKTKKEKPEKKEKTKKK
ncbi:MAG: 30S ribosomal protein S17e [Candidatus Freyarchaeum deiterrae]